MVGLLRLLCYLKPSASQDQLDCALAVMAFFAEQAAGQRFAEERATMVPVFDQVMVVAACLVSPGLSHSQWGG